MNVVIEDAAQEIKFEAVRTKKQKTVDKNEQVKTNGETCKKYTREVGRNNLTGYVESKAKRQRYEWSSAAACCGNKAGSSDDTKNRLDRTARFRCNKELGIENSSGSMNQNQGTMKVKHWNKLIVSTLKQAKQWLI